MKLQKKEEDGIVNKLDDVLSAGKESIVYVDSMSPIGGVTNVPDNISYICAPNRKGIFSGEGHFFVITNDSFGKSDFLVLENLQFEGHPGFAYVDVGSACEFRNCHFRHSNISVKQCMTHRKQQEEVKINNCSLADSWLWAGPYSFDDACEKLIVDQATIDKSYDFGYRHFRLEVHDSKRSYDKTPISLILNRLTEQERKAETFVDIPEEALNGCNEDIQYRFRFLQNKMDQCLKQLDFRPR